MLDERENPTAGGAAGLDKTSLPGGNDCPSNAPETAPAQIKFQDPAETEFDGDIALALTASGWRAAACLLTHAALLIEAGDYPSAERNRQRAREQFIAANDVFRQFQEARAEGASLLAGAFLRAPP
jgi:hypothetical protein